MATRRSTPAGIPVFFEGHGDEAITGFDAGGDVIDLSWFETAITFEQLRGKFSATTGGTLIDPGEFGRRRDHHRGSRPGRRERPPVFLPMNNT